MNGPKAYLKWVDLQFRFSGHLSNTHIRVDIIRLKHVAKTTLFDPNGTQNFPPYCFHNEMKYLAGFTGNKHGVLSSENKILHMSPTLIVMRKYLTLLRLS